MKTSNCKRILIIGLDGFVWKIGKMLIQDNHMPTLGRLIQDGCHGNLRSVLPYETSPAWSSFQTGCYPNKTGIFSFHTLDSRTKKIRLNSYCDIRVPTLWEILSSHQKKTICINMPMTSPPPEIKGIVVPGLLCPELSSNTVYPSEIFERYIRHRKDYQIVNNTYSENTTAFAQQSCRTEQARCEVALELMGQFEWDVFCFQMQSTDLMQHRYWWALDADANGYNETNHQEATVFYSACDDIIAKLIQKAGPDTTVIIISDHGFTKQRYSLAINRWLLDKGYLVLLEKEKSKWQQAKEEHPSLKYLAERYGRIKGLVDTLKNFFFHTKTVPHIDIELLHLREFIDFEQSKAFCLGAMGGIIYANPSIPGRGDFLNQLTDELLKDFGPAARPALIKTIKTCSAQYGDVKTSLPLPDLIIEYEEGISTVVNPLAAEVIQSYQDVDKQTGTHDRNGVFVAQGNNIKHGFSCDAWIVDVVPTVLAMLDIPIPKHMDGRVLREIFETAPEISYTDLELKDTQTIHYSDKEQSEVEKRLADLGYL